MTAEVEFCQGNCVVIMTAEVEFCLGLVWFGFTALQHFIGYIAPVSVVKVRMSAHTGLVGSYHLAPSNSG